MCNYNRFTYNDIKLHSNHICYYCHKQIIDNNDLTIDHLTPKSRGGLNVLSNLKICCRNCNQQKGNMTESEYRQYLLTGDKPKGTQNVEAKSNHITQNIVDEGIINIDTIKIPYMFLAHGVKAKKVNRAVEYFKLHHKFDHPIIINQLNHALVDGYARVEAAKLLHIDNVPVSFCA